MRILIAQQNPTVGALDANVDALVDAVKQGREAGVDLVVAPELATTGYPPRDLLDRPTFVRDAVAAAAALTTRVHGPTLAVGAVVGAGAEPLVVGDRICNALLIIRDGQVQACHRKVLLPTYDVFDEARYFAPGTQATVATVAGVQVGLSVCEDIWNDKRSLRGEGPGRDPVEEAVQQGAELILNASASPYDMLKPQRRQAMLTERARRHGCPIVYANQVGGNDSLIFDGRSLLVDAGGEVAARAPAFASAALAVTAEPGVGRCSGDHAPQPEGWEADVADALCLGLADYVRKCGFDKVVLGLSGGIDSALTCALAVRALGPDRVIGVAMPSRYSSSGSVDDARRLAERTGIRLDTIAIEPIVQAFLDGLADPFAGLAPDVTEENIQARVRGSLLMAYSNKLGALLLATGNKSEVAVGYCTLYGDMCGGLAVISDLYKTQVYALARHLNLTTKPAPIPESSLTKAPSAELRPDQTDQDSLPPYDALDAVLRGYVDETRGVDQLVADGHDPALVRRVVTLVERAEYKRRQMAPGLRVSAKAFGEGRRLPIAQTYSAGFLPST